MPRRGFFDKTKVECEHGIKIYVTTCDECEARFERIRKQNLKTNIEDDPYSIPGSRG